MNFIEVLGVCVRNKELVREFDRLNGANLSMMGSPIDLMVDEATGKQKDDLRKFVDFVYEFIWLRVELEETRNTVLDLFCQACTIADKSGITKYDHMCRGTYEYVQEDLIEWGLLKADDCVRR